MATDPRTTPEEMQMIMSRLSPAPMKLSAGEGLVGRKADGSYGELYSQASKDQYAFSPDGMHILNKGNGRVTAPDGAMGGFHTLTPQEKETMGLPADGVFQMSPNGQLHTPGGQTINVGGEQNLYDNAMSKTMAENHTGLMQGVEGNRTKLRDLNMMSGALPASPEERRHHGHGGRGGERPPECHQHGVERPRARAAVRRLRQGSHRQGGPADLRGGGQGHRRGADHELRYAADARGEPGPRALADRQPSA